MARKRRTGPAGKIGTTVANIPATMTNGLPVPMIGVSVPEQIFGLTQAEAFEQAVGIKTNVLLYYYAFWESWPSAYVTVVASGRTPMIAIDPDTASVNISGAIRNSDGGIDSPMVSGIVYKGVVISAINGLAANATQPIGTILSIGGDSIGPMVATQTAMPSGFTGTISTATFTPTASYSSAIMSDLAGLVGGTYDSVIQEWASYAAGVGIIRFASEMNGNWNAWSFGSGGTGYTATQYKALWNHVRSVWQTQETSRSYAHCPWMWCPNVSGGTNPFSSAYPGDSECEYVALDGYSNSTNGYQLPSTIFSADFTTMSGLTSHPQLIGETGVDNGDYSRAAWITALFSFLEANPSIKGFSYFDHSTSAPDYFLDNDRLCCVAFNTGVVGWAI